jgi:hypothetical protein
VPNLDGAGCAHQGLGQAGRDLLTPCLRADPTDLLTLRPGADMGRPVRFANTPIQNGVLANRSGRPPSRVLPNRSGRPQNWVLTNRPGRPQDAEGLEDPNEPATLQCATCYPPPLSIRRGRRHWLKASKKQRNTVLAATELAIRASARVPPAGHKSREHLYCWTTPHLTHVTCDNE